MAAQPHSQSADRVVAWFASRQFGVVARRQLLRKGVTRHQIAWRLAGRRLIEFHRGVYLAGHEARHPNAAKMAALLAGHPSATLSHRTAADLWGILPYPAAGDVWITIPPEREATHAGIRTVRAQLHTRDRRRRGPLTVTSQPRTLLDLAAVVDVDQLERAVAEAQYRRLASEAELQDQLTRNPRKPGIQALRRVLDLPGGPQRTRSPAERGMLRLLRRGGFTGYETNAKIHGYEVDVLWRELDFAIEVDGYDAHAGRIAFERDRLKLARLGAKDVSVMPVTGRQLQVDPDGVERRLREALAAARRRAD